jgi:hypothetical protein
MTKRERHTRKGCGGCGSKDDPRILESGVLRLSYTARCRHCCWGYISGPSLRWAERRYWQRVRKEGK